jgi:hypothetical protein
MSSTLEHRRSMVCSVTDPDNPSNPHGRCDVAWVNVDDHIDTCFHCGAPGKWYRRRDFSETTELMPSIGHLQLAESMWSLPHEIWANNLSGQTIITVDGQPAAVLDTYLAPSSDELPGLRIVQVDTLNRQPDRILKMMWQVAMNNEPIAVWYGQGWYFTLRPLPAGSV